MTKTVNIYETPFEVSTPYEAGHKINEAEARALNQVRAENIANNMRKVIRAALDSGDPKELEKAKKAFAEYDKNYEINLATTSGRTALSPLEKEAYSVASAKLTEMVKKAGMTRKSYEEKNGKDYVKAKIAELAAMPEIIEVAKENLERADRMANIKFKP